MVSDPPLPSVAVSQMERGDTATAREDEKRERVRVRDCLDGVEATSLSLSTAPQTGLTPRRRREERRPVACGGTEAERLDALIQARGMGIWSSLSTVSCALSLLF